MSITPTGDLSGALASFQVQAGPQTGQHVPIRLPVVTIGRAAQNEIVIPDDSVSTTHARLEFMDGGWRITDLDSKNGTYLEKVRLGPQVVTPLPYGTSLRFGGAKLVFRPVENADPESARSTYAPPERQPTIRERRSGFRLPVWLLAVLLILLVIAALLFGWIGSGPTPTPTPSVSAITTTTTILAVQEPG